MAANITIQDITIRSENTKSYAKGNKVGTFSNVQALYLRGVTNLVIDNVTMENMYTGIKVAGTKSGQPSNEIIISNLTVMNSRKALHLLDTENFSMRDSLLDADVDVNYRNHVIYLDGGNKNLKFDNVTFQNATGAGMQMYTGYEDKAPLSFVEVNNSKVINTRSAVTLYNGVNNISFNNFEIEDVEYGFNMNGASDINVDGVTISNLKQNTNDEMAIYMVDVKDISIKNATIDVQGASLINHLEKYENVSFDNVNVTNISSQNTFYTSYDSVDGFTVTNSRFEWSELSRAPIQFLNSVSNVVFENNEFINSGSDSFDWVSYSKGPVDITLTNNEYVGFDSISHGSDLSLIDGNTLLN